MRLGTTGLTYEKALICNILEPAKPCNHTIAFVEKNQTFSRRLNDQAVTGLYLCMDTFSLITSL